MSSDKTVLDKVKINIIQHSMISKGDTLVVGVSGGADSICLLYVLSTLRETFDFSIKVVHVNHMLRGLEADMDQKFVEELAHKLGIECIVERIAVKEYALKRKLSLEEAGREIRYGAFKRVASKIAVAHNKNDQSETVLMNLIRGAGNEGLVGMAYVQGGIIRPLLNVDRNEIEEYCKQNGLLYRTDSTNFMTDYTRNKVRLELIPYIQNNLNKNIANNIINLSELVKEENDFLENICICQYKKCMVKEELGKIILDINRVNQLHTAIKRRVLRKGIKSVKGDLKGVEYKHINSIIELCEKNHTGKQISLSKTLSASVQYSNLNLVVSADEHEVNSKKYKGNTVREDKSELKDISVFDNEAILVELPGVTQIDKMKIMIKTKIIKRAEDVEYNPNARNKQTDYYQRFDYDKISRDLVVRYRQEGDRIHPKGATGTKKLKDFFIDQKIPREKRDKIPLLVCNSDIVWIAGYRSGEAYKVTDKTENVLYIEFTMLE